MANFKYIHKLRNARIVIFGATSGFGFAVAEAAIEHGANVILCGSNQQRLDGATKRLEASYSESTRGQITTAVCDLADVDNLEAQLQDMFNTITNNGVSKIDHIVFTADDAHAAPPVSKTTPNDIYLSLRLRVYSSTILAKVVAANDFLQHSPDASVTLTNGVNGHKPVKGWVVPGMASTALEGLVRGLAVDLAPVRVNLVSAGPVATELLAKLPQEYIDMYEAETLTKRLGRPEDVAEAYLYAMKDGSATGSIIFSDGGRRLA
ncbi:hypothetical protein MHUMG1_09566 [Metarhizium humberi]|uniref:NAD(P)-binding domain protein n=1 Tax=Metarhizium humberi TaxID=2596975 RepID=A0A9P8S3I7_9HYPO|nr:hypothetical protein MHUMG1_09566 [Metarhizium humberi]